MSCKEIERDKKCFAIQHCYKYSKQIQGTLQGLHARFTDLDEKLDKRLPAVYQKWDNS